MTFRRPATNRQLTFKEIAKEAKIPLSEVCLLALSAACMISLLEMCIILLTELCIFSLAKKYTVIVRGVNNFILRNALYYIINVSTWSRTINLYELK